MGLCPEQVPILVNTILQKAGAHVPALAPLTALVVLVHWAVLMGLPGFVSPERQPQRRAMMLRTVAANDAVRGAIAQIPVEISVSHTPQQRAVHPMARRAVLPQAAADESAPTEVLTQTSAPEAATLLALASTESTQPRAAPEPPGQKRDALAGAVAVPASARLEYDVAGEVKGFRYSADSELLWKQDGQQYSAKLEIKVFLLGSRSQTSTGLIDGGGLEPTRFLDKARSEQAAHFERDKGIIVFSANAPSAALQAGAQDRLSVVLQLGALLAGAPARYPPGTTIALQVVGPRDAEDWQFTVGASEVLKLPGGNVMGTKLSRHPRSAYDQKLDLWLAPSMGYLPVRLRLSQDNGDYVDQKWRASLAP
jgi:hypothetical protein